LSLTPSPTKKLEALRGRFSGFRVVAMEAIYDINSIHAIAIFGII
jgi:hypothetical protein